jgi:predicted adenine nucleotide alpha hydrolase (AANH) superfamily ATPase
MKRKRLLLHICCAPDAAFIPDHLSGEWDVTCFFFNPNIFPSDEHDRRAAEMKRLAAEKGYDLISPSYQPDRFSNWAADYLYHPEKSGRCSKCYRLRLEETAAYAGEHGYDAFASVLTVSPHKPAERVNRIGQAVARKMGVHYLDSDFKKEDGYRESVKEARRLGLYRQDYCGCESSLQYRTMFKSASAQAILTLVAGKRIGIYDVQSFRKWLDRHQQDTGFLFYTEKPTKAVFREAYELRVFLEPDNQLEWRQRIFEKKNIPVSLLDIGRVSNRDIFQDPF